MSLRCKFKVDEITLGEHGDTLRASPVYESEGENKAFWDATPGGLLELNCTIRGRITERLLPGMEFYLDLIPIPAG